MTRQHAEYRLATVALGPTERTMDDGCCPTHNEL